MDNERASYEDDLSQPESQASLTRNEHFKSLLLRLSQKMTETNVSELRFTADVRFSGSIAIDLLSTMRDEGIFGPSYCTSLEELLRNIKRFDLADMVREYMKVFPDEDRPPSVAEEFDLGADFSAASLSSHSSRSIYHHRATSPLGIPHTEVYRSPHSSSCHSLHSASISYASSPHSLSSSTSRHSLSRAHNRTGSVSHISQPHHTKSHIRSLSVALPGSSGATSGSQYEWAKGSNPHLPAVKSQSFSGSPSIPPKIQKDRVLSAPASSPNINNPRYVDENKNQTTKDSPREIEPIDQVEDDDDFTNELSITESRGVVLRETRQSQISDDVTPRASVISSQTRSSTISTLTEKSSTPSKHEAVLNDVEEEEGTKGTPPREKSLRQMIPFFGRRSRPNSASSYTQSSSWRVYRELIKPIWNHQDTVVLTKPGKPMELNANCGKHNPKLSLTLHPNGLFQDAEKAITASFRIITPEKCPLLPPSAEVRVTLSVHCNGIKYVVLTHSEKLNTSIFYLFEVLTHDFLKQSKSKFYSFDIDTTCSGL